MNTPLVSVICICYNQAAFVEEALQSVLTQSYTQIELIVADDASHDGSQPIIKNFCSRHTNVLFIENNTNRGNCATFNAALALAKGKYVIDLAADDILLPHRVARQVEVFELLPQKYGVVFSNATLIDQYGKKLRNYYPTNSKGQSLLKTIPTGNIYEEILANSFICTPTMMFRKSLLDELGGYDQTLSYEDFDLWVRSSRQHYYFYLDEVTTLRRIVAKSLGQRFREKNNHLLASSLVVCWKAKQLNQNQAENQALARRLRYFIRQCWFMHQFDLAHDFAGLLAQTSPINLGTHLILLACRLGLPIHHIYLLYLWLRQKLK